MPIDSYRFLDFASRRILRAWVALLTTAGVARTNPSTRNANAAIQGGQTPRSIPS